MYLGKNAERFRKRNVDLSLSRNVEMSHNNNASTFHGKNATTNVKMSIGAKFANSTNMTLNTHLSLGSS